MSEERPIQFGGSIIKLIKTPAVATPKLVPAQSISNPVHVGMSSVTCNVNMQGQQSGHGQNMVAVSTPKQLAQADTTTLPEMVIQQPQVIVPAHYISHVSSEQLTQTVLPVQGQYEQHIVQQPVFQQAIIQQPASSATAAVVETTQQIPTNSAQSRSVVIPSKKRPQESSTTDSVANTSKKK